VLDNGKTTAYATHIPDAQVLAGIDPKHRLLVLAAFENVSWARAARMMADHGAVDVIPLDGGGSASMVLGQGARGVGGRTLLWPDRAVATHFGVRAAPLE